MRRAHRLLGLLAVLPLLAWLASGLLLALLGPDASAVQAVNLPTQPIGGHAPSVAARPHSPRHGPPHDLAAVAPPRRAAALARALAAALAAALTRTFTRTFTRSVAAADEWLPAHQLDTVCERRARDGASPRLLPSRIDRRLGICGAHAINLSSHARLH